MGRSAANAVLLENNDPPLSFGFSNSARYYSDLLVWSKIKGVVLKLQLNPKYTNHKMQ